MKKVFLVATLIAAISTSALADGKKSAQLLNDLKASLKNVNESAWTSNNFYRKASFMYNGKVAKAFLNVETGNLVGFAFIIDQASLPEGTKENLAKHYKGWEVSDAIMFVEESGNIAHYAQVTKGNKSIALKVSSKGKLNIYARMPY